MSANIPVRAIVFDFGGVLIDWNPWYLYRDYFKDEAAMHAFLNEIEFADWNHEQDRGRPFAEAVVIHSEKYPQHADLIRVYDERWADSIGGAIGATVEILRALKRRGYPLFGLSNWSAEKFVLVRERFPFFDLFDTIVLSGQVKLAKPDPRIFELLLEQTGCRAEECLFIDDAEKNIKAAQALGFQIIHFDSPEQLADELERLDLLESEELAHGNSQGR
ncbi:MAG: HAD family phosphatase [Anaerolineae bacterium]|nr:HAD family phosphatase [Anaerolineae bacterium]